MILLVVSLVDTNVLVYRWDPGEERKQRIARDLLRTWRSPGDRPVPVIPSRWPLAGRSLLPTADGRLEARGTAAWKAARLGFSVAPATKTTP